jgi:hypothetical protein
VKAFCGAYFDSCATAHGSREQETTDELYANISTGDYEIPQELPVGCPDARGGISDLLFAPRLSV